jgi:molybdopterin-guanine dinucleotide biosynthesis protein A
MGTDKALIPLNGKPMIARVAEVMRSVLAEVCISANQTEPYGFLDLPIYPDLHPSSGPLGGLHSAFAHTRSEEIFLIGCDMPFVSRELIEYIVHYPSTAPARAALTEDGRVHPICGVYHRNILPLVVDAIAHQRLKMLDLLRESGATLVPVTPDLSFYRTDLLHNFNDASSVGSITQSPS